MDEIQAIKLFPIMQQRAQSRGLKLRIGYVNEINSQGSDERFILEGDFVECPIGYYETLDDVSKAIRAWEKQHVFRA